MQQTSEYMKKKQTHRYREQTSREREVGRGNIGVGE